MRAFLDSAAIVGTKIVAEREALRAAHAAAAPWFPPEAAQNVVPTARSSRTASIAPRALKDPLHCMYSCFSDTASGPDGVGTRACDTGVVRTSEAIFE